MDIVCKLTRQTNFASHTYELFECIQYLDACQYIRDIRNAIVEDLHSDAQGSFVCIAYASGHPVGIAYGSVEHDLATLQFLTVSEPRRGIGRALVRRCDSVASTLLLEATASTVPFYAKCGFVIDATTTMSKNIRMIKIQCT